MPYNVVSACYPMTCTSSANVRLDNLHAFENTWCWGRLLLCCMPNSVGWAHSGMQTQRSLGNQGRILHRPWRRLPGSSACSCASWAEQWCHAWHAWYYVSAYFSCGALALCHFRMYCAPIHELQWFCIGRSLESGMVGQLLRGFSCNMGRVHKSPKRLFCTHSSAYMCTYCCIQVTSMVDLREGCLFWVGRAKSGLGKKQLYCCTFIKHISRGGHFIYCLFASICVDIIESQDMVLLSDLFIAHASYGYAQRCTCVHVQQFHDYFKSGTDGVPQNYTH